MARKRVRYKFGKKDPNHASFGAFMMSEQAMRPTRRVVRGMRRYAKSIAPRSGDGRGLPYADSFEIRPKKAGIVAGQYRNRRVAVELVNTAPHGAVVEYGRRDNPDQPPRRILLRSGAVYGDVGGKDLNPARWGR